MPKASNGPPLRGDLSMRAALRVIRAAAGLTQDAMAARVGISRVTYVRLERGQLTEPHVHIERIIQLAGLGTEGWWSLLGTAYRIYANLQGGTEIRAEVERAVRKPVTVASKRPGG